MYKRIDSIKRINVYDIDIKIQLLGGKQMEIKDILKKKISIKRLVEAVEDNLLEKGYECTSGDYFDANDSFADASNSVIENAYDIIFDLFVEDLGWAEEKLESELVTIQEELGEILWEESDLQGITDEVRSHIEEREHAEKNPYSSRGLRQSDFY